MEKIFVMVNGLPGNVAKKMAQFAIIDNQFDLVPYSLTGQDIEVDNIQIENITIELIKPVNRAEKIIYIKDKYPEFISIDYTHPTAVNDNAVFYTKYKLPFVMGTTGGDREALDQVVKNGGQPSVVAPNMAKQIVGFQAMMKWASENFAGLFDGYDLTVVESHQSGKADTSGTAKTMVDYFNDFGANFDVNDIEMIRDPKVQKDEWKIPEEHISGHGWHTYSLKAKDGSALFEFKHNINGRDIYVRGTFDAVLFLKEKLNKNESAKQLYTMIDVLNGK